MLFIPYNTDAPVYHFPSATLGLIGANVVCFVLIAAGLVDGDAWVLHYGTGLHPLQWVTSLFNHLSVTHLLGNLIFLWVFGLVVEGKVGWRRFLAIYLFIGVAENLFEQAVMSQAVAGPSGSAGASGAIFGLMAMAMVWAPKNDVQCWFVLFLVFVRVFEFDVAIATLSILYIATELILATVGGFSMSSQIIHLLGGLLGFGMGILMLRRGAVDCEGWDLISVLRGRHGGRREPTGLSTKTVDSSREDAEETQAALRALSVRRGRRVAELTGQRKFGAAFRELRQLQHVAPDFRLDEEDLAELAQGLYRQKRWRDVMPLLHEFSQRFPDRADGILLQAAAILVRVEQRPKAALRALKAVRSERLTPDQQREFREIVKVARSLISSGHLELEA